MKKEVLRNIYVVNSHCSIAITDSLLFLLHMFYFHISPQAISEIFRSKKKVIFFRQIVPLLRQYCNTAMRQIVPSKYTASRRTTANRVNEIYVRN